MAFVRQWWNGVGSRRRRRALCLILVVGATLRVAWVAYAAVQPSFGGDPQAYLLLGEGLAHGHGYRNPLVDTANELRAAHHLPPLAEQPTAYYPPGYPTFIAAIAWAVWHSPIPDHALVRVIALVQALLGVATILMAFVLARRLFGAEVALVAAALVALYPNLIALTATLQFETLFIALSLAAVLVLFPIAEATRPSTVRLVVGGALTGAIALVHPPIAFFLVAVVVTRWIMRRRWRDALRTAVVLAVAMVVTMSPWIIRNAIEFHALIPTATGAGPALCQSRNPEATGMLDTGILVRECQPAHLTGNAERDDVATNSYATRTAIKWVVHHPLQELRMWFWRTQLAYREDTTGLSTIRPHMDPRWYDVDASVATASSFVVLGFAAFGVAILLRRRTAGGLFVLGCTLAYAAMPIILFGDPRYRVPAEPFFLVLAAGGVAAAWAGVTAAGSPTAV